MNEFSKKSLVMLVLVAAIFSIVASAVTVVAIDKIGSIREAYGSLVHSSDKLPSGTITLYVEPKPTIKTGEVRLEVK